MRSRLTETHRSLELGEILPAVVRGNESLLREALLELLENACRHADPRVPVRVSVTAEVERTVLTVTSAGPPIPPDRAGQTTVRGRPRDRAGGGPPDRGASPGSRWTSSGAAKRITSALSSPRMPEFISAGLLPGAAPRMFSGLPSGDLSVTVPQIAPVLIDGGWRPPRVGATREVRNPATLELLGAVADCGAEDVDAAVAAARRAQPAWWRIPGVEKARYLHQVAARIRSEERTLATLMTRETGKPLIESVDCIEWVAACFDYYAEVGRRSYGNSIPPVAPHQINFTIKEPYGVVAAIVPFNFPLLLMAWKVAPALAAGNTLVCKPPHQNPLCNLLMARCYEALPPGVVNLVTGAADTGEAAGRAIRTWISSPSPARSPPAAASPSGQAGSSRR